MSETILEEAQRIIYGDREASYGRASEDFGRTAALWEVILGAHVSQQQVALCMVAVKISRLLHTPEHRDSVVDIAGYAGTIEKLWREWEEDRAEHPSSGPA